MQLIHLRSDLDKVDGPLYAEASNRFNLPFLGLSVTAAIACLICILLGHGTAGILVMLAFMAIFMAGFGAWKAGLFLPVSAQRFLWRTRRERWELEREARQLANVYCLIDRNQHLLTSGADIQKPWQKRRDELRVKIEAYAARYREAVATDLAKAAARPVNLRRQTRYRISRQAHELGELEAAIEKLGAAADPAMQAQADEMRARLEEECRVHGFSTRMVQARKQPKGLLPAAHVVKGGRSNAT